MKLCREAYVQVKRKSATSAKCFGMKKDMLCMFFWTGSPFDISEFREVQMKIWDTKQQWVTALEGGNYCNGKPQMLRPQQVGNTRLISTAWLTLNLFLGTDLGWNDFQICPSTYLPISFCFTRQLPKASLRREKQNVFNSMEGLSKLYRKLTQYLL